MSNISVLQKCLYPVAKCIYFVDIVKLCILFNFIIFKFKREIHISIFFYLQLVPNISYQSIFCLTFLAKEFEFPSSNFH